MSRFQCDELRMRALDGATSLEIADEKRRFPSETVVRKHLRGECGCHPTLPALEYVGHSITGGWEPAEKPPCPMCETDLFVTSNAPDTWHCEGCGDTFDVTAVVVGLEGVVA